MSEVRIGLLGLGTIGSGIVKLLDSHRALLEERVGGRLTLAAIADHACVVGVSDTWTFSDGGVETTVRPRGRWRCNSGQAVLDAALAGLGLCQLPNFYVDGPIATGDLVPLLENHRPEDEGVWAVYPHLRHLPAKVRLLVEHLEAHLNLAA